MADTNAGCSDCIKAGCTLCAPEKGTLDPVCVCEGLGDGFFGNCNDFVFGSTPRVSQLDCIFDIQYANTWVGCLAAAVVFVLYCIRRGYKRRKFLEQRRIRIRERQRWLAQGGGQAGYVTGGQLPLPTMAMQTSEGATMTHVMDRLMTAPTAPPMAHVEFQGQVMNAPFEFQGQVMNAPFADAQMAAIPSAAPSAPLQHGSNASHGKTIN